MARKPPPPAAQPESRGQRLQRLRRGLPYLGAALLSGLMVAAAFPALEWWWLAWASLIPLLAACEGRSFRQAFCLGLVAGGTANTAGFFWMKTMLTDFGHLPAAVAVPLVAGGGLYQGLSIALAVAAATWMQQRKGWALTFTLPVLYTAAEAFHPILFPWNLGNCQYRFLSLIQIADLVGANGVTFLVVMGNAALYDLVRSRMRGVRPLAAAGAFALLLGAAVLYGHFRLEAVRAEEEAAPKVRMGVVEPEIPILEEQMRQFPKEEPLSRILRWNTLGLQWASHALLAERPDLIIWPESSFMPVLSVYGRRSPVAEVRWRGSRVELVGPDGTVLKEQALDHVVLAGASRGEDRTYLVGEGCSTYRLNGTELVGERADCAEDLAAVAISCHDSKDLRDTAWDACLSVARGKKGALLVRQKGEWRRLTAAEVQQLPAELLATPPSSVRVQVPFTRYYWWIPEDATWLYRTGSALPESHDYPGSVAADVATGDREINSVQRGFDVPLLVGATSGELKDLEDPNSLKNRRFNSAFLLDSGGRVLGRYDKQYLLTFGEYMPYGDTFPFLYEWIPESGRFSAGPQMSPLPFRQWKLGVLICYEDILAGHTSAVAAQGANALINLTNDAWFGKTQEAWQHFILALFRCVEQRLPLVRSTLTGISGFVHPTGEIGHACDPEGAETFIADVPMMPGGTVYQSFGHYFPAALALLSLVLTFLARRKPA